MKIDRQKLDFTLAEQCKCATDLRGALSPAAITRIRKGYDVGTKTAGKLARALNVPLAQIIQLDGGEASEPNKV